MDWNPVLEDKLKRQNQTAGWRWIGYILVGLGTLGLIAGIGWSVILESEGMPGWYGYIPGGLFMVTGLLTALPAEKAAKEARELKVQREYAMSLRQQPNASSGCLRCRAPIVQGQAFCGSCGAPAGA